MNILVTGGGTGGHLYPGLTIAEYYAKNKDNNVFYIASANGIDQDIIKAELEKGELNNIKIDFWDLHGFQRQLTLENITKNSKNIFKLISCNLNAKKFLKDNKIDVVIGVGGYISFPLVKTALKMGIKTLIHEQNSYPGLVNRKLGNEVDAVLLTYKSALDYFPKEKVEFVSNPRVDLTSDYKGQDFSKDLGLNKNKKKLLFLGGSLGADTINKLFLDTISNKDFDDDKYQAILISGIKNNDIQIDEEELNKREHIILNHTSELLKYIATSDIVISRGGATTLLEIVYLEKPSLIIPSPNVVANHQLENAKEFANVDLMNYILEKDLENKDVFNEIELILNDKNIIKNLQKFDKINSMEKINKIIEDMDDNR